MMDAVSRNPFFNWQETLPVVSTLPVFSICNSSLNKILHQTFYALMVFAILCAGSAQAALAPVASDVLVAVDESGSMSHERRWISEAIIDDLFHGDGDSGIDVYTNGAAVVQPSTVVPEPSARMIALMALNRAHRGVL
jgi:hypothetical protein